MVYHQTKGLDIITDGAYHQKQAVFSFAMMMYNFFEIDDMHAFDVMKYETQRLALLLLNKLRDA